MKKSIAISLCGGTITAAAKALDITPSAISQWPEDAAGDLAESAMNRVLAYMARKHLPRALIGDSALDAPASSA